MRLLLVESVICQHVNVVGEGSDYCQCPIWSASIPRGIAGETHVEVTSWPHGKISSSMRLLERWRCSSSIDAHISISAVWLVHVNVQSGTCLDEIN